MRKAIQIGAAALLATSVVFGTARASGQETVEELRKTVTDLVKRLDEVQKKLEEVEKKQAEQSATPAAAPAPASPAAAPKPKGLMDVYWKEGLHLDSAENENGVKPFQLRLSGRIQLDSAWMGEDDDAKTVANSKTGVELRRVRIGAGGIIYGDYEFIAEYEFSAGQTNFKDVWIAATKIPFIGRLEVGHDEEFASLDELTSDNDTLFVERALPNVFAPSRNVGLSIQNTFFEQRMTAGMGVYKDTDNFGFATGADNYAFTGRITGLPYYHAVKNDRVDNLRLVHLGFWGSFRGASSDAFRVRQRPDVHLAEPLIDTFGLIGPVEDVGLVGGEAAMIYGPFSMQGEYMVQMVNRIGTEDVTMQGGYVQAGYVLTGEHHRYKTATGALGTVIPKRNFQIAKGTGGPGAWELALRYSRLDLNDKDVTGGTEDDITAGVNWYLNPNMKIMLNYVHAWINRDDAVTFGTTTFPPIDGNFDGVVTRFQVNW